MELLVDRLAKSFVLETIDRLVAGCLLSVGDADGW
jgi:hypothetical protein